MKPYLLSTAIVAATAGMALAQETGGLFRTAPDAMDIHASEFIGMNVYAAETTADLTEFDGVQDDWNDIGEINDVILSRDGMVQAVLVDIGGFLGMGVQQVAVDMSAIRLVSDAATPDDLSDYFILLTATRADLEAAPSYDVDAAMTDTTMGEATVAADDTTAMDQTGNSDPMMREGYVTAEADYLTSERLTGATVYDASDAAVGEISDLILSEDGQITQAVVDVGGFLGIGEKPVALDLTGMDILRDEDGDEVRVYLRNTRDELDAMPTYNQ